MALIVQKFGGTSVGTTERIKAVAGRISAFKAAGHQLVVVVSAMSGETNRLIALAKEVQTEPDPREYDVVVSTGEQVTIGLLCMALLERGVNARSYTGGQVSILTDSAHTKARIRKIDEERMRADLAEGRLVVVAGFQGVDAEGNVTTLGRGGSDTTAVALAAALKADECQIYTDVDGVYTTDPRIVPEARRLKSVTFEEMLEMASLGSKILQIRSVEFAGKYKVPLGVLDRPGIAYAILGPISDANIDVDMIIQNASVDGLTDLSFTVHRSEYQKALDVLNQQVKNHIKAGDIRGDPKICKVSMVGVGMRTHAGIASQMFRTLAEEGINIQMISTSEIKISVVIDEKYMELAVRALHKAFGLDQPS